VLLEPRGEGPILCLYVVGDPAAHKSKKENAETSVSMFVESNQFVEMAGELLVFVAMRGQSRIIGVFHHGFFGGKVVTGGDGKLLE
jgi:hypothetical protein